MARPERTTLDFFPHYVKYGKKMFFIEKKYGNDGYATWYKILEKIATTTGHFLNLNEEEEVIYLASKCNVSEERLLAIISDLSRVGAFEKSLWKSKIIWSQKFIDEIQEAYKRRNSKCMDLPSLCKHLLSIGIHKPPLIQHPAYINPQSRLEESRDNNKSIIITPYRKFKHLEISNEEVEKLKDFGYSKSQITNILDSIENYGKNKQYTSLYLTAKKWLEREYPRPVVEPEEYQQIEQEFLKNLS